MSNNNVFGGTPVNDNEIPAGASATVTTTDIGQEMAWDATLTGQDNEFILLQNSTYDFEVTNFQRARYNGSEKMSACYQAKLTLTVHTQNGDAHILHNLFLNTKCEGMLKSFFRAIGQRKKDEDLKMNWNAVLGAKGRAVIGTHEYNDKKYNEIKKFVFPDDAATPASGFGPGKF